MTLAELRACLRADGVPELASRAAEIMRAARAGALLWTSTRLATLDASRIDVRLNRDGRKT